MAICVSIVWLSCLPLFRCGIRQEFVSVRLHRSRIMKHSLQLYVIVFVRLNVYFVGLVLGQFEMLQSTRSPKLQRYKWKPLHNRKDVTTYIQGDDAVIFQYILNIGYIPSLNDLNPSKDTVCAQWIEWNISYLTFEQMGTLSWSSQRIWYSYCWWLIPCRSSSIKYLL